MDFFHTFILSEKTRFGYPFVLPYLVFFVGVFCNAPNLGRPKGACGVAAPGPPVAKLQCTASLAGARPARFTSVPGRATVAFKVGRVAKHANKKDEVRNHKGVSKPRLFA